MHLADTRHDAGRAVGEMLGQPILKQGRHLARQPQRDDGGRNRACIPGCRKDRLKLVIC